MYINVHCLQVVSAANKPSQTRMNISFCAEFDEAVLSAMDKLERDYEAGKITCENNKAISDRCTVQDVNTTRSASSHTNLINCNALVKECANKTEFSKFTSGKSGLPSSLCKQNAVTNTPHSKTNGQIESLDNGSVCTWVTPLHISTPVDAGCKNTVCNIDLAQLRSEERYEDMNVNCVNATPRVKSSKSKSHMEKTKLFQAILNSSADDGIVGGHLSSNSILTSTGLVEPRDGAKMQEGANCDQAGENCANITTMDVSIKISKLKAKSIQSTECAVSDLLHLLLACMSMLANHKVAIFSFLRS
jgi:hypothetical protein